MSSNEYKPDTDAGASDNDYKTRSGQNNTVPVVDDAQAEQELEASNPNADSDEQLAADDNEAINEDNILSERTRNAKPQGSYREPGDDEGLEQ